MKTRTEDKFLASATLVTLLVGLGSWCAIGQLVERVNYRASGLGWEAPTTNEDGSVLNDLAGYRVYQNDVLVADVGTNEYIWTSFPLLDGTTNVFYVTAYDLAGNESTPSPTLSVIADLTAPGTPGGITIKVSQTVTITLAEAPSTVHRERGGLMP
jgi:hypothetical protein